MALSSDLAGVFQIILAQQAAEARKEEKQQDVALTLLSMDLRKEQAEMDREVTLLDRQIARNEKRYDTVLNEFQTTKDEYQEATGLIYKLPEAERKGNAPIDVLNDIKGGTADSLNDLLLDIKRDTQNMQTAKGDMERQIYKSGLISDFYKGFGHDMSKGDPERWDAPDFGEEALTEYIAQYPELEGVDQQAFYEGVKTREEAGLFQNIQALNVVIDQAKTAELSAATKQLEYNTKIGNIDASQLEVDIDNIDSGVHSMISKQATSLNTGILSPAISATSLYAEAQESGTDSDILTAKELQEEELIKVGTLISGIQAQDESMLANNLRLGMLFVSGNANYVNSIPGYLKGSGELNYDGWIDALQEIQYRSEYYKSQLDVGAITAQDYVAYQNNIEELIGDNLNNFSDKLGVLIKASESVENKGQLLALKSMQNAIEPIEISSQVDDYNKFRATDFNIDLSDYPDIIPPTTPPTTDDPALKALSQMNTMTGAEFDFDRTYFQGRDAAALRAMSFPINIDVGIAVGDKRGQISIAKHSENVLKSIVGSQVNVDAEIIGDQAGVVDARIDEDGRIMLKIAPDIIGLHPATWKVDGKPIYLDEVEVMSNERAPSAMPTAFVSGVPYFYDPMEDKYVIQSNRLKD